MDNQEATEEVVQNNSVSKVVKEVEWGDVVESSVSEVGENTDTVDSSEVKYAYRWIELELVPDSEESVPDASEAVKDMDVDNSVKKRRGKSSEAMNGKPAKIPKQVEEVDLKDKK